MNLETLEKLVKNSLHAVLLCEMDGTLRVSSDLATEYLCGDFSAGDRLLLSRFSDLNEGEDYQITPIALDGKTVQYVELSKTTQEKLTVWYHKNFQNLIEVIPYPIFWQDSHQIYLGCNQAFCDLAGVSRGAIYKSNIFGLVEPQIANQIRQSDRRLLEEGGYRSFDIQFTHKNGQEMKIRGHKVRLDRASGEKIIVGLIHKLNSPD